MHHYTYYLFYIYIIYSFLMIAQNEKQVIGQLMNQPVCQHRQPDNGSRIFFGLTDMTIRALDLEKLTLEIIPTKHEKRINNIRSQQNLLITCSNDSTVKIFDKLSFRPIHSFRKAPDEIYSIALKKNILAAGGDGRILFWDLRNMKEKISFKDSFNGEITGLQFDPQQQNILYGCSVDGFLNCFDLRQSNEDDAGLWYHRLDNPPQQLKCEKNNFLNIHTTDHSIIILKQESVVKKVEPNTADEPRHVLWSAYENQNLRYYVWNINNNVIEKWEDSQCVYQFMQAKEVEFLEEITGTRSIMVDIVGEVSLIQMEEYTNSKQDLVRTNFEEEEDINSDLVISKEGFVKKKYRKVHKAFKPF